MENTWKDRNNFERNQKLLDWFLEELTKDGVWRLSWFKIAGDYDWW